MVSRSTPCTEVNQTFLLFSSSSSVLHTETSCFSLVCSNSENWYKLALNDKLLLVVLQLIESWDQEMRARLLQFVTGTSKV